MKKKIYMLIVAVLILSILVPVMGCKPKAAEPIKIGFISSITGPTAACVYSIMTGVELAVKEINDGGGILDGGMIKLLKYDDRFDPAEGVSCAKRAIEADKVKAVVGLMDRSVAQAVAEVTHAARVPISMATPREVLVPGTLLVEVRFKNTNSTECAAIETMIEPPVKSCVVIGPETDFLYGNFDAIREYWTQPGSKVKIYDLIAYSMGSPDVTTPVMKALSYNPDLVWSFDWTVPGAIQTLRTLREAGYNGPIYQMDINNELLTKAPPELVEGLWGTQPWFPELETPQNKAFIKKWIEVYGQENWYKLIYPTMTGYLCTMIQLQAMDKAGTDSDWEKIQKAYYEVDWVTPMGYKAKIVTVEGIHWFQWKHLYFGQVRNGKYTIVKEVPYPPYD